MANCNCNSNCNSNCNNNCNCTPEPTSGCFSTAGRGFNSLNCSCIPCDAPVIVQPGPDLSNQTLIPVLADVIQNCATINRYETALPGNLIFLTSFPTGTVADPIAAPSGTVCITGISYSYDCIGVPGTVSGTIVTPPTITGFIDSRTFALSPTQVACSCRLAGTTVTPTPLYNQFAGSVTTNACCCNQTTPPTAQQYALSKIVETAVSFSVCNLNVTIQGTIGGCPFTAALVGTGTQATPGGAVTFNQLPNPTALSTLGFPAFLNFAGRMCLPTGTRINISEQFENCLTIDCVRPLSATYTPVNFAAPLPAGGYYLRASADLSLIINKQIYATTTEKLAVLTTVGTEVVCNNGTTIPTCPQPTPCSGSTVPCPAPRATV